MKEDAQKLDADVVIMGAGPVGLTMALTLLKQGITSFKIFDKSSSLHSESRGLVVHARTLETLQAFDSHWEIPSSSGPSSKHDFSVVEQLIKQSRVIQGSNTFVGPSRVGTARLHDLRQSAFNFALATPQYITERVLREAISSYGIDINWNCELSLPTKSSSSSDQRDGDPDLKEDEDVVSLHILDKESGTISTIRTKWLVACDGAHSTVRKYLSPTGPLKDDISFEGSLYDQVELYAADLVIHDVERTHTIFDTQSIGFAAPPGGFKSVPHFPSSLPPSPSSSSLSKEEDDQKFLNNLGALVIQLPEKGHFRIITAFLLSAAQQSGLAPTIDPERDLNRDYFQRVLEQNIGIDPVSQWKLEEPYWKSKFKIHCRLASSFRSKGSRSTSSRSGRIFLAGDSAHLYSPYGGQGMNMGVQDAFNLGWKLGLVLRNRASPAILSTYQEERKFVSMQALRLADGMSRITLLGVQWKFVGLFRDRIFLPLATVLQPLQELLLGQFSGLTFNYAQCPGSMRFEDVSFGKQLLRSVFLGTSLKAGARWPNVPLFRSATSAIRSLSFLPDAKQLSEDLSHDISSHKMFQPGLHHLIFYDPTGTFLSRDQLTTFFQRNDSLLDLFSISVLTTKTRSQSVDEDDLISASDVGSHRVTLFQIPRKVDWLGKDPMALIIRPDGYVEYLGIPLKFPSLEKYLSLVYLPSDQALPPPSGPLSLLKPIPWKSSISEHTLAKPTIFILCTLFLLFFLSILF